MKLTNLRVSKTEISTDSGIIIIDGSAETGKLSSADVLGNYYEGDKTPTFVLQPGAR
jgi:hypothetical protein